MTLALVAVVVSAIVVGATLRGVGWLRRARARKGIAPDAIVRELRGLSMRVLVQNTRAIPGMSTSHANRTTGDLVLTGDRVLLVCNRGVIADLRQGAGQRFRSVRCTGPGRLVIEGEVPTPSGPTGMYRVEAVVQDAREWAQALRPWIREGGEFASL